MNVYDFDRTIYDGDSTIDFYLYSIKKHPVILRCLPRQLISIIKYKLKLINKTEMKEGFYVFFRMIPDIDYDIDMFWNKCNYIGISGNIINRDL